MKHFGAVDQVFLRCHLDGTLFVNNGRAKFQPGVDDRCPWCGAKDGFEHRAWTCPFFEQCRSHLTTAQRQRAQLLPQAFSVHGWALGVPEWELYLEFLLRDDGFRKMSPVGLPSFRASDWCDLFVDGACAHPAEPKLRYGAWAVTMAVGGPGSLHNHLVLGSHLQGICQSAFRAELTAVHSALQWASERCMRVRIWCDCLGVVQGVRRLLHGGRVHPNRAHSGLWQGIADILRAGELDVQIIKVVSHCRPQAATTAEEEWAYWHNKLADEAATSINERREQVFWTAWRNLAEALVQQRQLHMAILQMLLRQSWLATSDQQPERAPEVPVVPPAQVAVPAAPPTWTLPEKMYARYCRQNVEAIHPWWSECGSDALSGRNELKLVGGIHLFLDFQWTTRHKGPYLHKKRWFAHLAEVPDGCVVQWSERVKPFLLLWKAYLKFHGLDIPHKMSRPSGAAVSKWVVAYYLRWPEAKINKVDQHIFQVLGRQASSRRDLSGLTSDRQGP